MCSAISEALTVAWNTVVTIFQNICSTISEALTVAWNTVKTVFQAMCNTIKDMLTSMLNSVITMFKSMLDAVVQMATGMWNAVSTWFQNMANTIHENLTAAWQAVTTAFSNIYSTTKTKVSETYTAVKDFFGNMYNAIKEKISSMYNAVKGGISSIYSAFTGWISNLWNNVFSKLFDWIDKGISKLREFFGLNDRASSVSISTSGSSKMAGHASGGVFNREHVARFAEGNKAEAIIPLENEGAMQPFVDAVANGITASLMPIMATVSGNQNQLPPMYVGTLIADERSLKELNRRMQVIQLQESRRRG